MNEHSVSLKNILATKHFLDLEKTSNLKICKIKHRIIGAKFVTKSRILFTYVTTIIALILHKEQRIPK